MIISLLILLKIIDLDIFRNNENVEGATHKQVVDLIKSGGDCLTLTVISVTQQVTKCFEVFQKFDFCGYCMTI